jgi:8-oxo-dGTP pyrophosphatase MutT (NUDIX family)
VKLLQLLPLHAEEGNLREVIPEATILSQLATFDIVGGEANATLSIIRRLYDSLALLDRRELATGRWAFVSFPASLLGRSLLETLANQNQQLFESHYWEQGAHRPADTVEAQRALLKAVESRRVQFHPEQSPNPIRVVHVAWGMIRLSNQYLLTHREDKKRKDAKDYVFPGGRLIYHDLPKTEQNEQALRKLFCANSTLANESLERTLYRELGEELGLIYGEDYQSETLTQLTPYSKVEGAANNHGFSTFNIKLFSIKLTPEGELKLLSRQANEPDRLVWFNANELALQRKPDGKTAFIDALIANSGQQLKEMLETIPDSSGTSYRFTEETDAISLPAFAGEPFVRGKTGRFNNHLSKDDWAMLQILAWHARCLSAKLDSSQLQGLGGGWLHCTSPSTQNAIQHLVQGLNGIGLPLVDVVANEFARLSVKPEWLFFSERQFSFKCIGGEAGAGLLSLTLAGISTDYADLQEESLEIPLNRNMMRAINAIHQGADPEEDSTIRAEDLSRDIRKNIHEAARQIGLRKFVQFKKTSGYSIVVHPTDI